jgi:hypothetical protein
MVERLKEHEHETHLRNVGFGFGQLDYFCIHCEKRVKSVPLAEMTDEEKKHVGILVADFFARGESK